MSSSKNLEKEYDLLSEKVHHLRMALAIETDAAVKFKLEYQIEEAEEQRKHAEIKRHQRPEAILSTNAFS